jgi:hypothetical protein
MGFDDFAYDCQPEPGTIGARGHEGFKDVFALVLRDARATIFYAHAHYPVTGLGGNFDCPSRGRVSQSVEDEIV